MKAMIRERIIVIPPTVIRILIMKINNASTKIPIITRSKVAATVLTTQEETVMSAIIIMNKKITAPVADVIILLIITNMMMAIITPISAAKELITIIHQMAQTPENQDASNLLNI
jgi:hypothetical protein